MITIRRGTNCLLTRPLIGPDGSALDLDQIVSAKVQLVQSRRVLSTHALGASGPFRRGSDDHSVVLELTSAFTLKCEPGPITERYIIRLADSDFSADAGQAASAVEFTNITLT